MMSGFTDVELIEKCLMGEQDYFTELVRRYKNLVYSTVSYYIKDTEEVNDAAQEVFLKIYRCLKSYNPQYKFSTWTVVVAKNLCIDYIRKKKGTVETFDGYESMYRDDDTPEAEYIKKEKCMEIKKLIDRLPEKYRALVIMHYHNGLSYREMSEKMGEPMSIIKNRLYRARLSLKENLADAPRMC